MKTIALLNHRIITGTLYAGAALFVAAAASAQNLYVSAGSTSDSEILQYTPSGGESLVASGMDYPDGIAFDSAGDLFIANTALNNGESGNITEIMAGGGTRVFASGVDPIDVAFDSAGDLFECEYRSGDIYEFKNNFGTLSSTPTTYATGFGNPLSLAFDRAGNLYVGAGYGAGNGYITKIAPGNVESSFATGLTFPTGMAFNGVGDMFVTEQGTGIILEYTPGGVQSTFVTLSETDLDGLAFNSADDLFVAAGHSSDIVEVTPNGTPTVFESVGSELGFADGLAFQGVALPAPEPSTWALLAVGVSAVGLRLRRKK